MKRIFLAIGMAALMLVSGTNVYLANQRTEMENNLSLEDIEAEGWPFAKEAVKWIIRGVGAAATIYEGYEIVDELTTVTYWETHAKKVGESTTEEYYRDYNVCLIDENDKYKDAGCKPGTSVPVGSTYSRKK